MLRIVSAFIGSFLVLMTTAAHAACPQIPENDVWGKVSNNAIMRYVQQHGDNDWASYIAKWEDRLERIQEVANKNSVIVFHKNDLWLRGADLDRYVRDVQNRLSVTRCMAHAASGRTAPGEALVGTTLPVDGT